MYPRRAFTCADYAVALCDRSVTACEGSKPCRRYAPKLSFAAGGRQLVASLEALLLGHEDWVHSVAWQPCPAQDPESPPYAAPPLACAAVAPTCEPGRGDHAEVGSAPVDGAVAAGTAADAESGKPVSGNGMAAGGGVAALSVAPQRLARSRSHHRYACCRHRWIVPWRYGGRRLEVISWADA